MALLIPDASLQRLLDRQTADWGNTLVLHLYKNNYTPVAGDTVANYTEANYTSYASQNITTWGASTMAANTATATAAVNSFVVGNYTQQSTNNVPPTSGLRDANGGFVGVPAATVPEPTTLALFGAGAEGVRLIRPTGIQAAGQAPWSFSIND